MHTTERISFMGQPVPELPVADVELAQQYYRGVFGFRIGWLEPDKQMGAVTNDHATIFFRRKDRPFEPAVHWVFVQEIDSAYQALQSYGANITDSLGLKPWGLRQFTVEDLDRNVFHFHSG